MKKKKNSKVVVRYLKWDAAIGWLTVSENGDLFHHDQFIRTPSRILFVSNKYLAYKRVDNFKNWLSKAQELKGKIPQPREVPPPSRTY